MNTNITTNHVIAKCIPQTRLLKLIPGLLSSPSYSDDNKPSVDDFGIGLASHLAFVKLNSPETFSRIEGSLQTVVPVVTRIRFDRYEDVVDEESEIEINGEKLVRRTKRKVQKDRIILDLLGAESIPADLASEGTILVLGLLTILLGSNRPRLLLLDDIDKALHPRAQRELVRLLREILGTFPDLQIVATSHSPYLLDELQPEEVRLTTIKEDGSVVCGRLDQHPDFDRWKDEMRPGEFWSLVGESWLAEPKTVEAAR